MSLFGDICDAFDIKPETALSVIGGIFSLGGLIVNASSAAYKAEDEQKRIEEAVRREVNKANGRGYN